MSPSTSYNFRLKEVFVPFIFFDIVAIFRYNGHTIYLTNVVRLSRINVAGLSHNQGSDRPP